MKKIIGYIRCSSCNKHVRVQSLNGQEDQIKKYAYEHNMELHEVIKEKVRSALSKQSELEKLITRVRRDKIQSILCVSLDRMCRNPEEWAKMHSLFRKHGVKIYTLDGVLGKEV